ncbi:hypothetical protein BV22DRAFT_682708 [Leucogyrophana mollusca]|uniref:Uncharacterized protein n=1 Tax=Leucogyrophana mollusca TaxID=85980 RepID=A0ACB8B9U9_9AGAM|nr:hypothetical protein BV22DRAFT_682708 [Leucogyrophana mollusca]
MVKISVRPACDQPSSSVMSNPAILPSANIDALIASSVGALGFLFWELCITFDDEVAFIWGWSSADIANHYIGFPTSDSPKACKTWLIVQVSTVQVMITLVELILMLRDHRMKAFLVSLSVSGTVIAIIGLILTVPETQFTAMCDMTYISSSVTYFSFTFVIIEGILLFLTVVKCICILRTSTRRAPMIVLMLRDGTLTFLVLLSMVLPLSVLLTVAHGEFVSLLHPWFIAIYSCAVSPLVFLQSGALHTSALGMQGSHQYAYVVGKRPCGLSASDYHSNCHRACKSHREHRSLLGPGVHFGSADNAFMTKNIVMHRKR